MSSDGMSLGDFETHTEALKNADEIVKQNQEELGHSFPPVDHANPLLVKVVYIHSEGKNRTFEQTETNEFSANADAKNKKQLVAAKSFLEGIGDGVEGEASSASSIHIEKSHRILTDQANDPMKSYPLMQLGSG